MFVKLLLPLFFSFMLSPNAHVSVPKAEKGTTKSILRFVIRNKTKKDLYLAVNYIPYDRASDYSSGSWETKGWYTLSPEQSYYFETKNLIFYYYAESTTTNLLGQKLLWEGNTGLNIRGEYHNFVQVSLYKEDTQWHSDENGGWYEYDLDLVK